MSNKLNIAYHMPSLYSNYAQRTIYNGLKNAFIGLGYGFFTFTSGDVLERFLYENEIDLFITCSNYYYQKYLDYKLLKKYRDKGMKLFTKIDFWDSPLNRSTINGVKSMKNDKKTIRLIKEGLLGDIFFHVVEQGDCRMDGFEKETGYKYYTIPLAADKTLARLDLLEDFKADITFIGTSLPHKRHFFKEYVFPLGNIYNLILYGQDWTVHDKFLGFTQRFGQYFNMPYLKSIQKPKLQIKDEPRIYSSSKVSINVHEDHQRKYGGDCNERTFKIPIYGGFEITDNVACIRKYFEEGVEIVIARDKSEWFEKIDFYVRNPDKRIPIIEAGRKRVLQDHTYHNRVKKIIEIYNKSD
jgi:hypothetical protein